ncbi:glycosyltransferase [Acidobacteriota bacterium]
MNELFFVIIYVLTRIILVYFFLINTLYLLFLVLSGFGIRRYRNLTTYISLNEVFRSPMAKPVSVLTPAFNEEMGIIQSAKALLTLEYPQFEVIIINDGSTDSTMEKLKKEFKLEKTRRVFRKVLDTKPIRGIYISKLDSRIVVVDKENGGKADALNTGLNVSRYPLFCTVDADSILEKDALLKTVRPFLENPDEVVGAGGIVRLSNGSEVRDGQVLKVKMPRNFLARFQILEYFRAFLAGRMGLSMLKSVLIVSGAFAMFRKDVVLGCKGYRTSTVTEDMDLVVRIHKNMYKKKRKHRIYFIPDPICWTEGPESLRILGRQRNRWHRGLIDTLLYNGSMLFNPRYRIIGMFALPFYFIFEMLGPLIEIIGYVSFVFFLVLGLINTTYAILFFVLAVIYGILISMSAILLEEYSVRIYPRVKDVFILALFGFLENFIYRQFLAFVRAMAFIDFFAGKREWGRMKRIGFDKPE